MMADMDFLGTAAAGPGIAIEAMVQVCVDV
jgi:hypothetical protein